MLTLKTTPNHTKQPTLGRLLLTTFYIGVISYGGPAILAQMKKTFTQNKLTSEEEFMESLSLAQILPGATGVTMMGYFGYKFKKFWGAILMPLSYILPATIAMIIISWAYFRFGNLSFVKPLFVGLGALVVALLLNALLTLGKTVYGKVSWKDYKVIIISLFIFVGIYFFNINTIWLILLAGLLGFLFFYFASESKSEKLIEKEIVDSEIKEKSKIKFFDYLPLLIVGMIVIAIFYWPITRDLFVNFFEIGTFAFGGGFTTIPLIQHIVVSQLHWVNFAQFRDGIAMGQITPGPVFITATFIGYKVLGIVGALVATIAIFMPSLIFIVLLSKVHAKIKHLKAVRVVVKGFLAGFIGLIAAITIQFAFKSLINWQTWLIFLASFGYIWYFKKNAVWAILATVVLSFLII